MQADNMYLSELTLFGYKFPACIGETMSWQKLKLKNKEEVYLVCGEAEKGSCEPPAGEPTSEPCDSPATGTKTRTWNYSTCQWNDWNKSNCKITPVEKTYAWTLTDNGHNPNIGDNNCISTCTANNNSATGSAFVSGGALVSTTTAFTTKCSSSTKGKVCMTGRININGVAYCPTYTCQAQ